MACTRIKWKCCIQSLARSGPSSLSGLSNHPRVPPGPLPLSLSASSGLPSQPLRLLFPESSSHRYSMAAGHHLIIERLSWTTGYVAEPEQRPLLPRSFVFFIALITVFFPPPPRLLGQSLPYKNENHQLIIITNAYLTPILSPPLF